MSGTPSPVGVTSSGSTEIDAVSISNGTVSVERQVISLGDPTTWGNQASVDSSGNLSAHTPMNSVSQFPGYLPQAAGVSVPTVDSVGSLMTRGAVLTDEGSFRTSFDGATLGYEQGAVTISGSTVTGTFSNLQNGDYFKNDADADTAWVAISSFTPTTITLSSAYSGTMTGTGSTSKLLPQTGTTYSYAITSGAYTLTTGVPASGQMASLQRYVDYGPLSFRMRYSSTNRQSFGPAYAGFIGKPTTGTWAVNNACAMFVFAGTSTNTVSCFCGRNWNTSISGTYQESYTVTLPNGALTTSPNDYRIDVLKDGVYFYINNVLVATCVVRVPTMADPLWAGFWQPTQGTVTSNVHTINYINVLDHDEVLVGTLGSEVKVAAQQPSADLLYYDNVSAIPINTYYMSIDCQKYRTISLQCTLMGASGVTTPYWTNDNVNYTAATLITPAGIAATTFSSIGMWTTQVLGRYLVLKMTTATSSETTITAYGMQSTVGNVPTQPVSGSVTATLAGSSTITNIPSTAQGSSTYYTLVTAAATNAASIKTSAATIGYIIASNNSATGAYLKLYNIATVPTMGSSSPSLNVWIPPSSTINIDTGAFGLRMSTGLSIAVTAGIALLDGTALTAGSTITVNMAYT